MSRPRWRSPPWPCWAVALARPRITDHIPTGQANMMLVTDHSGSMAAEDVQPNRLAAAVSAANTFIDQLPSTVRVGAIGFGSTPDAVQGPAADHSQARSLVDSLVPNGGTDTGDALQLALQLLQGSNRKHPPSAIVLLSDGAANAGPDPVAVSGEAKKDRIPIYTVALGTAGGVLPNPDPLAPAQPVPPDPQLMQEIARVSGGSAFNARSADELSSIYKKLGSQLSTDTRKKEITAWFAAAGVVLLIGAAVVIGALVRPSALGRRRATATPAAARVTAWRRRGRRSPRPGRRSSARAGCRRAERCSSGAC